MKERDILPIRAEKGEMSSVEAISKCSHYAGYGQLLGHVFARTKWNPDDFV